MTQDELNAALETPLGVSRTGRPGRRHCQETAGWRQFHPPKVWDLNIKHFMPGSCPVSFSAATSGYSRSLATTLASPAGISGNGQAAAARPFHLQVSLHAVSSKLA